MINLMVGIKDEEGHMRLYDVSPDVYTYIKKLEDALCKKGKNAV